MAVTISIYIENVNAEITDGYTHIRLYRDTEPDGAFSTLVDSEALVASTYSYEIEDSTGTVDYWYRYCLYTGSVETALSEAWKPDGSTLLGVIYAAARRGAVAFRSTCGTSTTTELVDSVLLDNGASADFLEGAWILGPDWLAADRLRRVKVGGFNTTSGGLQPDRAWSVAPTGTYYVFKLLPPIRQAGYGYSWAEACQDGLNGLSYPDDINLGVGNGSQVKWSLNAYALRQDEIGPVVLRTTDATTGVETDIDMTKNGRFITVQENGPQDVSITLSRPPSTQESVIVSAVRRYGRMYALDDITLCPLETAARATLFRAYRYLNRIENGKYQFELQNAAMELEEEYDVPPRYVDA